MMIIIYVHLVIPLKSPLITTIATVARVTVVNMLFIIFEVSSLMAKSNVITATKINAKQSGSSSEKGLLNVITDLNASCILLFVI